MVCSSSAGAELQLIMKLAVEAHCSADVTQAAVSYPCSTFSGSPIYYFRSQICNILAVSIASKTLACMYLLYSICCLLTGVLPRHGARLTLEKAQALCCWMKCNVQEMSYL